MEQHRPSSLFVPFAFSLNSVNEVLFFLDNLGSANNYPPPMYLPNTDYTVFVKQEVPTNTNNSQPQDRYET